MAPSPQPLPHNRVFLSIQPIAGEREQKLAAADFSDAHTQSDQASRRIASRVPHVRIHGCSQCVNSPPLFPVPAALLRGRRGISIMSITNERKAQVIQEFRRDEKDTGSPEVQVAVLTNRINELTLHLKRQIKDHAGRRGLLQMVSKRRSLLEYLRRVKPASYVELIGRLGLRK